MAIYAQYYNYMQGERKGYVFKDRFASEPIKSEQYIIRCINYIHCNPVKAGIVSKCEDYKYSTYRQYTNENKIKLLRDLLDINIEVFDLKNTKNQYILNDVDIEKDKHIEQKVENFLEISNIKKEELFKDRVLLKLLIEYLKNESKIKYVDMMKSLNLSKKQMERIKKG